MQYTNVDTNGHHTSVACLPRDLEQYDNMKRLAEVTASCNTLYRSLLWQ